MSAPAFVSALTNDSCPAAAAACKFVGCCVGGSSSIWCGLVWWSVCAAFAARGCFHGFIRQNGALRKDLNGLVGLVARTAIRITDNVDLCELTDSATIASPPLVSCPPSCITRSDEYGERDFLMFPT